MHPCAAPGCPNVVQRGPYCAVHAPAQADARPSSSARGYNAAWQRLRLMTLRAHPLCADPFRVHVASPALASEVDHIRPLADGGTNDAHNLQCLCKSCHSRKTREDMQRRGARG
jgi:5-methylcytosine-specific restriction protein A